MSEFSTCLHLLFRSSLPLFFLFSPARVLKFLKPPRNSLNDFHIIRNENLKSHNCLLPNKTSGETTTKNPKLTTQGKKDWEASLITNERLIFNWSLKTSRRKLFLSFPGSLSLSCARIFFLNIPIKNFVSSFFLLLIRRKMRRRFFFAFNPLSSFRTFPEINQSDALPIQTIKIKSRFQV